MPWGKGAAAAGLIFLSGVEGSADDDGNPVPRIGDQTRLALDRANEVLKESGSTFEDVVRLTQYLTDRELRDGYHEAREAWLRTHAPKLAEEQSYAGVLLIQQLPIAGSLIELEITAIDREVSS